MNRADPRATAAAEALAAYMAGDHSHADAAKAAWDTSDPGRQPNTPRLPRRAGSGPHSPSTAEDRAARAEAIRLHYSVDVIPDIMWRIRQARGMTDTEPFEEYRHLFEDPGCAACDRGFREVGDRVAPCPACQAAKARAGQGDAG